jgi:hypothetical protein
MRRKEEEAEPKRVAAKPGRAKQSADAHHELDADHCGHGDSITPTSTSSSTSADGASVRFVTEAQKDGVFKQPT